MVDPSPIRLVKLGQALSCHLGCGHDLRGVATVIVKVDLAEGLFMSHLPRTAI